MRVIPQVQITGGQDTGLWRQVGCIPFRPGTWVFLPSWYGFQSCIAPPYAAKVHGFPLEHQASKQGAGTLFPGHCPLPRWRQWMFCVSEGLLISGGRPRWCPGDFWFAGSGQRSREQQSGDTWGEGKSSPFPLYRGSGRSNQEEGQAVDAR